MPKERLAPRVARGRLRDVWSKDLFWSELFQAEMARMDSRAGVASASGLRKRMMSSLFRM
jgi:hypothetical protein